MINRPNATVELMGNEQYAKRDDVQDGNTPHRNHIQGVSLLPGAFVLATALPCARPTACRSAAA